MADDANARVPEDPTYIVRRRDYADICKLEKATVAEQFLEEPLTVIAECVSGWLHRGTKESVLAVPRVAVAALKGKAFEQFGREFEKWRESGRVPDNYAEKKYGYSSLAELLAEIDSNPTDEDRLEALKAMFLATNKSNATDGERAANYQLFQIAKRLTSGQLLLLHAAHRRALAGAPPVTATNNWLAALAKEMGHDVVGLVDQDEKILVANGLLTERVWADGSGVRDDKSRLTDLAFRFCANIESYRIPVKSETEP